MPPRPTRPFPKKKSSETLKYLKPYQTYCLNLPFGTRSAKGNPARSHWPDLVASSLAAPVGLGPGSHHAGSCFATLEPTPNTCTSNSSPSPCLLKRQCPQHLSAAGGCVISPISVNSGQAHSRRPVQLPGQRLFFVWR